MMFSCEIQRIQSSGKHCEVGKLSSSRMHFLNISLGIQSYSQLMIGVSNHPLSIVFRFHYHVQKVTGSLGYCM